MCDALREAAEELVACWDAEHAAIEAFVATDDISHIERRKSWERTEAAEAGLRAALSAAPSTGSRHGHDCEDPRAWPCNVLTSHFLAAFPASGEAAAPIDVIRLAGAMDLATSTGNDVWTPEWFEAIAREYAALTDPQPETPA